MRHHNQATIRLTTLGRQWPIRARPYRERAPRSPRLRGTEPASLKVSGDVGQMAPTAGLNRERRPCDARRDLLEQVRPACRRSSPPTWRNGDVAAWTRQARDETAADRIGNHRKNDWDGACLLQHPAVVEMIAKNKVGLQRYEFLREPLRRTPHLTRSGECRSGCCGPPSTRASESLPERRDPGLCFLVALGIPHQHADPPHPVGLLRARSERPIRRRATEKRDELASLHVRPQARETASYRFKPGL